ncbi:MAG: Na+/H+ antiporter NhaC family protein [Bacteroidota bacterium]
MMKRLLKICLCAFMLSPLFSSAQEGDSLKVKDVEDVVLEEITSSPTDYKSLINIESRKSLLSMDDDGSFKLEWLNETNPNTEIELQVNDTTVMVVLEEGKALFDVPASALKDTNTFVYKGEQIASVPLDRVNYAPWLSLLPPLIAIILALVFREVVVSLFTGIFLGAAILAVSQTGSLAGIGTAFLTSLDHYLVKALFDEDHISIILFSLLIGGMVAIISKNGGMLGIVNRISRLAKTPKSGQLATWLLGVVIFFDDYANSLVVGNTMRNITDKLRISREKLSYIVDSTAAPVSALAFISTWIAAELSYIEDGMVGLEGLPEDLSPYKVFLMSLPYSFYPLMTLAFILIIIFTGKDFGPMLKAEQRARTTGKVQRESGEGGISEEVSHFTPIEGLTPKAFNAVIPVVVLVIGVLIGLLFTGWDDKVWNDPEMGFAAKMSQIIGNSNSYLALMWASLTAVAVALVMTLAQRHMSLVDAVNVMVGGFKAMLSAIIILTLAWGLQGVTSDVHTADFLTDLLGDNLSPMWLPLIAFLLGAMVSFSTGSSWGTMAILYPLVIPLAWKISTDYGLPTEDALAIFANVVASILAGSVLGDHCSPISDTTILSSLACDVNHIDHVRTQLPYALAVGVVAILIGTIPSSFGLPTWICFLIGIGTLFALVRFYGRYTQSPQA